jgi:hypothetical protein
MAGMAAAQAICGSPAEIAGWYFMQSWDKNNDDKRTRTPLAGGVRQHAASGARRVAAD